MPADRKRFSEMPQGETFEYNGSHFRKVSHTHAADAGDDAIVYPMAGEIVVTPIDDPQKAQREADANRLHDDAHRPRPIVTARATPTGPQANDGLDELTVEELKELAEDNEVEHTSNMRKADLVAALQKQGVKAPAE